MRPDVKDELIRKIRELEDARDAAVNPFNSVRSAERSVFDILVPLFSHDGFDLEFRHGPGDNGVDFIAQNENSSEKFGIQFKHRRTPVTGEAVRELIGTAIINAYPRMFLFSSSGFTRSCYADAQRVDPVKIELLGIDDIKNWVSRIEVEADLNKLNFEGIIKIVSKTFIGQIAKNPGFLQNLEWRDMERVIAELFEGLAFKVTLTPPSKDGGKDIILECKRQGEEVSYIVEVKHWRSLQRVGQESVKDFLKVICREKRQSGLFLSTYGFTGNAFEGISEIERKKISFGDQSKVVLLCKNYLKVKSGIWTPLTDLQELLFEETF